MPAAAATYSAYAPVNCLLVTPKTSSPGSNPATSGPTASTTPHRSDPSVSGSGCGRTLLPARIHPSHGPTPAALTRTSTSPAAGSDRAISSNAMTSGGPKRCTRLAFIDAKHHAVAGVVKYRR